jgi:ABC-2 type transport system permease protein
VILSAGYRRHSSYRGAQFAAAAANTVFGLLRSAVLLAAIASGGGLVAGYDRQTALAFVFIGQALLTPVQVFPWMELTDRIRTGDIAIDFGRPMSIQLQYGAADLGRAAAGVLSNMLPPVLVGLVVFGFFLPREPGPYLLALPTVVLAVCVSFGCRFLISLVAFWMIEVRGVLRMYAIVSGILCGVIVPITWFPDWLHSLARWTPFPSFVQIPADVISGRIQGWTALGLVASQLAWALVLAGAGALVLRRATRQLVVQGG